jgi:hypothetical protein
MTSSEDRYVKPAAGEDPREIDREQTDAELMAERAATRQVSHQQEAEGAQGISSDAPGFDASDRDRAISADSAHSADSADSDDADGADG